MRFALAFVILVCAIPLVAFGLGIAGLVTGMLKLARVLYPTISKK